LVINSFKQRNLFKFTCQWINEYSIIKYMKRIDLQELLYFLSDRPSPILETELLKYFFPEVSLDFNQFDFFKAHFLLHHHLYLLKDELAMKQENLLFIQLSSIYLFKYPQGGLCRYFFNDSKNFCLNSTYDNSYCPTHNNHNSELKPDGLRSYYLNIKNLEDMEENDWQRMNRSMNFLTHNTQEISQSLEILGVSMDVTLERLKKRYRYLSHKYHPDKQGNSNDFYRIKQSYLCLKKWKEDLLE
jgi:hypothetical protein